MPTLSLLSPLIAPLCTNADLLACWPALKPQTGPITVLNYTIYEIIPRDEVDILHFVGWVYLWSAIMHVVIAVCNGQLRRLVITDDHRLS